MLFFISYEKLDRHRLSCDAETKVTFKGGLFSTKKDLWEELELCGLHLSFKQKKHNLFTVFDFECLLKDSSSSLGDLTVTESCHKPISVSCASNCCEEHRKPVCIVDSNFDGLIDKWLIQLDVLCVHIRIKTLRKWGPILTCLRGLKKSFKPDDDNNDVDKDDDDDNDDDDEDDVIDDGEYAMDSSAYEDVKPEMLKALDKENVYYTYAKHLQGVENCDDYNDLSIDYNERASTDCDDSSGCESDEEVTFTLQNENSFKGIDEYTKNRMYHKVCGLYDKMYEYINRVPMIGFRSSKYDLLVVRSKLFP